MTSVSLPKGVVTASLTPFNRNLSPDNALLLDHCKGIIARGGNGILLLGTTGEANSLSVPERMEILDSLLKDGLNPTSLLVGTGTSSLTETITLTRHAIDCGVTNILVMPPFYYRKVTDDGLFQYFADLIDRVQENVRLYLYHFPAMSGIDISMGLLERLIGVFPDRIAGMKDSGGDLGHMLKVMRRFPAFRLYSGTERLLTETLDHGSEGCISATTNYSIQYAAEVYQKYLNNKDLTSSKDRMLACRGTFEGHVFAPAIKGVLQATTGVDNWQYVRPPLTLPNKNDLQKLIADIRRIT